MASIFDQVSRRVAGSSRETFDPAVLGVGGATGLRQLLLNFFLPELRRQQGKGGIEEAFLGQAETPGALFGAAETAARGTAQKLFEPGGEVSSLIARARGRTVSQGFAPEGAESAERGILGAATKRVADTFAEQAAGLESQRFGALTQAYGFREQGIRDLIESLFTGVASSEQLGLAAKAQKKKGLFGLGFGPF